MGVSFDIKKACRKPYNHDGDDNDKEDESDDEHEKEETKVAEGVNGYL